MRRMNFIQFMVRFLFMGFVLSLFSTAAAAVSVQSQINYYDIEGSDLPQLRRQVRKKAPIVAGIIYPIKAVYKFDWKSNVIKEGGGCRALSPTLDLSVELVMPRWLSQSRGNFETQKAWIQFVASAQQYLQQINAIVEQSGDRFIYQVSQLPNSTCGQLEALVDAKGRGAVALANQRLRNYQRQTQHGSTLGLKVP